MTAKDTHVFDVEDAYDADRVTAVYKCGICCALVEAGDCEDHAAWHAPISRPMDEIRLDPSGCGCTDCLTGDSVPQAGEHR